jgi:hypothetical protein
MKRYLSVTSFLLLVFACSLGFLVGYGDFTGVYIRGKVEYLSFLLIIFTVVNLFVEIQVLRMLPAERRVLWISDNPFLKLIAVRLIVLIFGGWLIVSRLEIETPLSHVTLAVLSSFFVGGIFETFRFLRGGK